jgi:hypothetical protein
MKKLLTLVLAGVAIKYFLDSEKGNQMRSKVTQWLSDAQDEFGNLIDKTSQKVGQTVSKIDQTVPGTNG